MILKIMFAFLHSICGSYQCCTCSAGRIAYR
nr:MAG TPA: Big defensin [Caudoviricetes sp.]DAW85761.1 MAG TPA: Big defensin [Bacteriophage sp.]